MLSQILFFSLAITLAVSATNYAFGEIKSSMWLPDEVLLKENYYGLIILDSTSDKDTTFDIVTDNEEAINLITETVTIPAGKHHGIIEFLTKSIDDAKIYAIFQDTLLESNVNVKESAANPTQLDLILPSDLVNVLVDENEHFGYVFLLNEFENPVIAKESILVELTSNGEIVLSEQFTRIEPGQHYAKFRFQAMGEGTISATASNLELDEEDISLDDSDEIELKIAIAPDPVPTDSSAELYFWLERDDKPYLPPHDVKVTLSVDKSTNLSFDSAVKGALVLGPDADADAFGTGELPQPSEILTKTNAQLQEDSEREFTIEKGQHYGRMQMYASIIPAGDIGISGLAESINPKEDEEVIKTTEIISISTESSRVGFGTETKVFAFPDPAYENVEIIVSSRDSSGPIIENNDEVFTVFTNNLLRLDFDNPTKITNDENYARITAKVIDFGEGEIFAERNEAESDEIQIDTEGKYVKNPELEIVPFPVLYDTQQDLFLIASSQEKIFTNAESGEEGNLVSITSRPSFDFEPIQESEAVIRIQGTISELLDNDPEISIASNAFTETETLEIYNPSRTKLEVDHPASVFPNEPFPIIRHITDLDTNLVQKSITRVSSITDMSLDGDLVYLNQTGSHGIIFYDRNSVPVESSITVRGAPAPTRTVEQQQEERSVTFTYDISVTNGEGSGEYEEGEDVTISAPATKDDYFVIKDKLVGWKNLPYKESEITFEADDDIETEPIYEKDYTMLFSIVGPAGGIGAIYVIKKKKNKNAPSVTSDEDELLNKLLKS